MVKGFEVQEPWPRHNPKLWLQPFLIIATTHDGGVLEVYRQKSDQIQAQVVTNAISISDLKKSYGSKWVSLRRRDEVAAFRALLKPLFRCHFRDYLD